MARKSRARRGNRRGGVPGAQEDLRLHAPGVGLFGRKFAPLAGGRDCLVPPTQRRERNGEAQQGFDEFLVARDRDAIVRLRRFRIAHSQREGAEPGLRARTGGDLGKALFVGPSCGVDAASRGLDAAKRAPDRLGRQRLSPGRAQRELQPLPSPVV